MGVLVPLVLGAILLTLPLWCSPVYRALRRDDRDGTPRTGDRLYQHIWTLEEQLGIVHIDPLVIAARPNADCWNCSGYGPEDGSPCSSCKSQRPYDPSKPCWSCRGEGYTVWHDEYCGPGYELCDICEGGIVLPLCKHCNGSGCSDCNDTGRVLIAKSGRWPRRCNLTLPYRLAERRRSLL